MAQLQAPQSLSRLDHDADQLTANSIEIGLLDLIPTAARILMAGAIRLEQNCGLRAFPAAA
jgi:hypothetical protein